MKNLAFSPATIQAKVGQTVHWTNQDSPPHNVTYVSGPKFSSSGTLDTGQTFDAEADSAGHDPLLLLDPPVHEGDDRRQQVVRAPR